MATTSHIDYRKINYDQLIDKPITRVASGVNPNTLTTAGVYDRWDGNRFIVTVDGQNVVQTIELKDGYQERTSANWWSTWTQWKDVSFANPGEEIMPTPSAEEEWKIIQYVGETDANFTHWYFYECVGDGQTPETFSRVNVQVQDVPGQAETMPTPSAENVGTIIQYTGDTNQYYTHAHFYEVIEDPENPGQYIREKIEVQDSNADAEDIAYDNTTSGLTATNVQDAIDEIDTSVDTINTTIDTIEGDITDIKNIVEVTTIDTPTAEDEGNIIQYKGETTANFTQGYFYKCIEDPENPGTYEWVRIDVQPASSWTADIIYVTQAEYDLVPAADKADPTKHYAVYETQPAWAVASSIVYITKANYNLLTPEEKMAENVHYYIVESL